LIFTIFLSSFKTIPSILLERKIRFDKLVLPQIAEVLIFNIILITLMLKNFGIESFSWAFLVSSIAGIPLYYFISPWRIGVGINKKSLVHLKFGLQFQAKNVLATIKDDLLTVILVRLLTFTEIGYIGFAQRISLFAYRYIVDSVTKVTFSAYSRIQSDLGVLKLAIEKSLFFTTSLMFPILTGLILAFFLIYFSYQMKIYFSPPKVEITAPKKNSFVNENKIELVGKVEKEATVTVNGDHIFTDKENVFRTFIPLTEKQNKVIIVVTGANGKKTTVEKLYFKR